MSLRTAVAGDRGRVLSAVAVRRILVTVVVIATAISALAVLLVIAAWRDDRAIESHRGVATAEVLAAGPRRSTISFVTPDGLTHSPALGVLYPSQLTVGQRIEIEYDTRAPNQLVRVKGRSAAIALVPAGSIIVLSWIIAAVAIVVVIRLRQRSPE